jgi:hypothetical protein
MIVYLQKAFWYLAMNFIVVPTEWHVIKKDNQFRDLQ